MMNRVTGRRTWLTREAINFGAADVISHDAHFLPTLESKNRPLSDLVILINFVGSARCDLLGLGDAGAPLWAGSHDE